MGELVQESQVLYWRGDDDDLNFGDALTELLLERALIGPRIRASRYRLIGSIIDARNIGVDLAAIEDGGVIAYWGCGARDEARPPPELLARCEFYGVRGPLTRDLLGLPADTPIGDPGLLAPLLRAPPRRRRGEALCIPHYYEPRSDAELVALTGADRVLRPRIGPSPAEAERVLDEIAGAGFVLAGALHGAIVAHAYDVPFAFFDAGHLDVPFKWRDFAASIDVAAIFVSTVADGRRAWTDFVQGRARRPPLSDILAASPYYVRPSLLLAAAQHDGLASVPPSLMRWVKASPVEAGAYGAQAADSLRRHDGRLNARFAEALAQLAEAQGAAARMDAEAEAAKAARTALARRLAELEPAATRAAALDLRRANLELDNARLEGRLDEREAQIAFERDASSREIEALERELREAQGRRRAAETELAAALALAAERLAALAERQGELVSTTGALAELHAALAEAEARFAAALEARDDRLRDAEADRDATLTERDRVGSERDAARAERDAAAAGRDAAMVERDTAGLERDMATAERDAALSEREAASSERNAALADLDAALAARDALTQALAAAEAAHHDSVRQVEQRRAEAVRLAEQARDEAVEAAWRARDEAVAIADRARRAAEQLAERTAAARDAALHELGDARAAHGGDVEALAAACRELDSARAAHGEALEALEGQRRQTLDAAADARLAARARSAPRLLALPLARLAARRRDWPAAETAYAAVLRASPDDAAARVQYGHALKEQGEMALAAIAYGRAWPSPFAPPDVAQHLAYALRASGQFAAAERLDAELRRGDEASEPATPPARQPDRAGFWRTPTLWSARLAARQGQWPRAARRYRQLLTHAPGGVNLWTQYGHALKESGQPRAARGAYLAALFLDPGRADTHLQLGHLMKITGRYAEAAQAYRRAAELDPGLADAPRELAALSPPAPVLPPAPEAQAPAPPAAPEPEAQASGLPEPPEPPLQAFARRNGLTERETQLLGALRAAAPPAAE